MKTKSTPGNWVILPEKFWQLNTIEKITFLISNTKKLYLFWLGLGGEI